MRLWFAGCMLGAALTFAPPASAQEGAAPFLGTWAVDVTQLPAPPDARPRSVTFTFSDAGEGRLTTHLEVVGPDGETKRSEVTHALDGSAVPITGNVGPDTVAVSNPKPGVMVMALSGQGTPYSMRVFTVAPDGESQTETAVYFQPDGKPLIRETRMNRVR